MSEIRPALREIWEEIPPAIQERIRNAGVTIETAEDLRLCVELIQKQESCCGDL